MSKKILQAVMCMFVWVGLGLTQTTSVDFNFWSVGAHSVAQGRMIIGAFGPVKGSVVGAVAKTTVTLANLPPESKGWIINNVTWYPNTATITLAGDYGFKVRTSPATPVGDYTLKLIVKVTESGTGLEVEKVFDYPLSVREPAQPLQKVPFPAETPLPGLAKWEQNMMKYGTLHADKGYIGCCGAFTGPWYYDGARAFLQMYDYTQNQKFLDFAKAINEAYANNIIVTKGSRLYAVFPHGLAMFWNRFQDKPSFEALVAMSTGYTARHHWGASFLASREEAFGLSSHVVKESVALARQVCPKSVGCIEGETYFEMALANVIGHFDQHFISKSARFVYPFMVGLGAEALIDYYEVSGDPEVPFLLKLAADDMYPNPLTWHEGSESMMIVEEKDLDGDGVMEVTRGPAPDLNMMIAPMYYWVFQQTGDVKYRDIGDRLFRSGTERAYLDGGKQFTQNYRWSFRALEWRKSPVPAPSPLEMKWTEVQQALDALKLKLDELRAIVDAN